MTDPMPYFAFSLALAAQWWAAYAEFLRKVSYTPGTPVPENEAKA